MCRVAALNQAWFEWEAHAPLLQKTGVLSEQAVESLKDIERTPGEVDGLDGKHAAVAAVGYVWFCEEGRISTDKEM